MSVFVSRKIQLCIFFPKSRDIDMFNRIRQIIFVCVKRLYPTALLISFNTCILLLSLSSRLLHLPAYPWVWPEVPYEWNLLLRSSCHTPLPELLRLSSSSFPDLSNVFYLPPSNLMLCIFSLLARIEASISYSPCSKIGWQI